MQDSVKASSFLSLYTEGPAEKLFWSYKKKLRTKKIEDNEDVLKETQ